MKKIQFVAFDNVAPEHFIPIVNEDALRTHLVDHAYFDRNSLQQWMESKIEISTLPDCRVRAVYVDDVLAGWCGIQPDDKGVELAIVISQKYWGVGITVFKTMMAWAKDLGHKEVLFHLLDSRREYKALDRISKSVYTTEQLGRSFTTYCIDVSDVSGYE